MISFVAEIATPFIRQAVQITGHFCAAGGFQVKSVNGSGKAGILLTHMCQLQKNRWLINNPAVINNSKMIREIKTRWL